MLPKKQKVKWLTTFNITIPVLMLASIAPIITQNNKKGDQVLLMIE